MKERPENPASWIKSRDVLWYVTFFGFACNYMVRINLNIAIVDMVGARRTSAHASNITIRTSECLAKYEPVMDSVNPFVNTRVTERFSWNEYEQGLCLGAFFWLHWVTQIPGGLLAQKYGTKLVFGLSNFVSGMLSFAIPMAAHFDYRMLVVIRALQGLIAGFSWPAMHTMTAKWIPPNERSKFVTAYLGSSVGAGLTFVSSGFIISSWSWAATFYISGLIMIIWYVLWLLLVFDSPEEHPRIGTDEKNFIIQSLGHSVTNDNETVKKVTPWCAILLSPPIWFIFLAQWSNIWNLFTSMTSGPTYLKQIHGWNIQATGLLSGMPHFVRVLFAIGFSTICDYLLKHDVMSRTNVRKLATATVTFGQAICVTCLAFINCDPIWPIVLLTMSTGFSGAVSSGALASVVDLSPNYAGAVLGLINLLCVPAGSLSAQLVGYLTLNNQTVDSWRWVFIIAAAQLFICGFAYLMFATSDLQPWNNAYTSVKTTNEELEIKTIVDVDDNFNVSDQHIFMK